MLNIKLLISLLLSLTFIISCSDNSTNSEEEKVEEIAGSGSFTVSGNVDAEHESAAYYTTIKNDGNMVRISINLVEAHVRDRDDSYDPTYSLLLLADLSGEPFTLSAGTYDMGGLSDEELKFAGLYTQDGIGYHSRNHNGTLTLSSASNDRVKATFKFTAEGEAPNSDAGGVITVSGEFDAECLGCDI